MLAGGTILALLDDDQRKPLKRAVQHGATTRSRIGVTVRLLAAISLCGAAACVRTRTKIIVPLTATATESMPVATEPETARREAEGPTALRMHGVDLRIAPGVVLHVRQLEGEIVSLTPGQPVILEDKRAYVIRIGTADAGLTVADLSRVLNRNVFAYEKTPLTDLEVSAAGNKLRLRGTLHKGGDVPVEIVGDVSATAEGEVRMRPTSIRVARIPAGPVLRLVGLKLDKLVSLRGARGARLKGNDIFLQPDSILPPPRIHGHVTHARVEGNELRLTFAEPSGKAIAPIADAADAPPDTSGNYLYFRKGTLRIGKLFMVHADLEIMDENPADPFDFSADDFPKQLVAGYVKNTAVQGLIVHAPDMKRLEAPAPER